MLHARKIGKIITENCQGPPTDLDLETEGAIVAEIEAGKSQVKGARDFYISRSTIQ